MVHKKYIKRDGKVFGPYLYENYRENGKVKTRYLGRGKDFGEIRDDKKKGKLSLLLILGIVFLVLILAFGGLLFGDSKKGKDFVGVSEGGFLSQLFSESGFLNQLFSRKADIFINVVGNNPPVIQGIDDEIYVCENKRLLYFFNVFDEDGDDLNVVISPSNPFFVNFEREIDDTLSEYKILSGILNMKDIDVKRLDDEGWALHDETVFATDGIGVDSAETDIVIIEVNDAPKLENIGAQTIWTKGDNSIFAFRVNASDEENADEGLDFNLSFLNSDRLFDINGSGFMYLEGRENLILEGDSSVYNLRVCVNDSGLDEIVHPEINRCLPDDVIPIVVCDDFSLTITNENRAPNITSYYPLELNLSAKGDDSLYFNLSVYDADGTLPDADWYVDNNLIEHDENVSVSEFYYSFGCGVGGDFAVKAVATDGELNDSAEWNISVSEVSCRMSTSSGGGGGGGFYCKEEWVCGDWRVCQNLKEGFEEKLISKYQESWARERCDNFSYAEENCGYQIRSCKDFNNCKTEYKLPGIMKECYYTENPACDDRIKNCHDEGCEILIDCGGPCSPCPTCKDGIKNQGEMDVDCGGPCSICVENPFKNTYLINSVLALSLLGAVVILFLLFSEFRRRKKAREELKKIKEKKYLFKNIYSAYASIGLVIILLVAGGFLLTIGSADVVIIKEGKEGFLGSYGLWNSFLRGFAGFFSINIIESVIGTNADLVVWDDADVGLQKYTEGTLYGKTEGDWRVYFYANYTDKSGEAINSGNGNGLCGIKFYDWSGFGEMTFNDVSKVWEYDRSFNDKGELNFEIDCISNYENLNLVTNIEITNTPPQINLNLPVLNFNEDSFSWYDFRQRILEDDKNDILVYNLKNVSGLNPVFYNWITVNSSGFIFVNATDESEAGSFDLGIEVSDSDNEAVSRTQRITIGSSNDAPKFAGLENKSFNAGDLFEYLISVNDEEDNIPFKVNINFMSCDNELIRGNCTLFSDADYNVKNSGKLINISFIPNQIDIGEYIINFSVSDNSSLGNKTTSEIISFRVVAPIWKNSIVLDYDLNEDVGFYLNLSDLVRDEYLGKVSFSYNNEFNSFTLNDGIIDFIPIDEDVGYHEVEIIASSGGANSPKSFSFNVSNVNDEVSIVRPLSANGVFNIDGNSNMEALENSQVEIFLFADDDDFKILQKNVYDEGLNVNLLIEGANNNLFEFIFDSMILDNRAEYVGEFIPRDRDVGVYNVTINVSDKTNNSDFLKFNLTVINRDYDRPIIIYPGDVEFELVEGVGSNLIFKVNHSVGDSLIYRFYIDGKLRKEANGPGDNSNFTWLFAPGYEDETYNRKSELMLVVLNPFFNELNDSKIWNLTIKHNNAPVQFIKDIGDKMLPYTYSLQIDLKEHFSDVDYFDSHYNQSVAFNFSSNASPSYINIGNILDDWTVVLSSSKYSEYSETLSITAGDLNMSNESQILTSAISNYFEVEFIEPPVVQTPVPSSGGGGGGGGGGSPISLKIITPREISGFEGETIKIPLSLINSGSQTFYDLELDSSAFKDGKIIDKIKTELDKREIKSLGRNQEEDIVLTVFFGESKIGKYEILVNVSSKSPRYSDWAKIHVNLERINESDIRELIVFTEEFVVQNPACIEIKEAVDEAKKFLESGNLIEARARTEDALNSCRENIEQVSVPQKRKNYYEFVFYLFIACLLALIIGLFYYFMRKRFMKGGLKKRVEG